MLESAGGRRRTDDPDDVDPHGTSSGIPMCTHPGVSQLPEPAPLAFIDRVERVPEAAAASRLHLDEAQSITFSGDDVELALSAAPVAIEDEVSPALEMLHRTIFTRTSEVVFRCHDASIVAPIDPPLHGSPGPGRLRV